MRLYFVAKATAKKVKKAPIDPTLETVFTVKADGDAMVWIENDTERRLSIYLPKSINRSGKQAVTENMDPVLFDRHGNEANI